MSTTTKEWTTEFTCTGCKDKVSVTTGDVTLGAFEYDDTSYSHTSRKPYAHCPQCATPHRLGTAQVPAGVLKQVRTR